MADCSVERPLGLSAAPGATHPQPIPLGPLLGISEKIIGARSCARLDGYALRPLQGGVCAGWPTKSVVGDVEKSVTQSNEHHDQQRQCFDCHGSFSYRQMIWQLHPNNAFCKRRNEPRSNLEKVPLGRARVALEAVTLRVGIDSRQKGDPTRPGGANARRRGGRRQKHPPTRSTIAFRGEHCCHSGC